MVLCWHPFVRSNCVRQQQKGATTQIGVQWYDGADTHVEKGLMMETILLSARASALALIAAAALIGGIVAVWLRLGKE